jgi:hypothetical protein
VDRIIAVVGLGNPGKQYETTRHNVGFRVLDRLALSFSVKLEGRKFSAQWGASLINRQRVFFLKPLTYMNRSGDQQRKGVLPQTAHLYEPQRRGCKPVGAVFQNLAQSGARDP